VRQGDIISPVIFNIIVDAVVREWYAHIDELHLTGLSLFFYADDGHLAGNNAGSVQEGINLIVEPFRRVGLKMNSDKTKAMVYFGGGNSHRESPEAYACHFDHSLPTQRQWALQKVSCPKCNKHVNQQHLPLHQHEAHGVPMLQVPSEPTPVRSQTYQVDFPLYAQNVPCPVQGCLYLAPTCYNLHHHFCTMHPSDMIIVVEEGEFPCCPHCKMFIKSVGPQHFATMFCRTQAACILERERLGRQAMKTHNFAFYVDEVPIDTVHEFKYLGHILSADDQDDAAVSFNINKANQAWWGMYPILCRDGANSYIMAHFYLAVVQAKLLFGSETWVLTK